MQCEGRLCVHTWFTENFSEKVFVCLFASPSTHIYLLAKAVFWLNEAYSQALAQANFFFAKTQM